MAAVVVGAERKAHAEWPALQELSRLVEEKSLDELKALSPSGVEGLCKRLGSHPQDGLPKDVPDRADRIEYFGENMLAEKTLKAYWEYLWEAVHDKILLLLLIIGSIELVVEMIFRPDERDKAWIEPVAIYVTVLIIINVQSAMDYNRERLFDRLSKRVAASNMRYAIRGGQQVTLTDKDILVGDILTFNSHMAAVIPADGVLVDGDAIKVDESSLTGEPEPIAKDADSPFLFSGTTVTSGQGRLLVVAVGENSVSGRIRKAVYDEDEEGDPSPLFDKLDRMANAIGKFGTTVAVAVFVAACIQGFAIHHAPAVHLIEYLLLALGILAVAVPEGLPLALTISLAISSNRMCSQNNLVKTLDSCETMGSVTTICSDKTGTLTANRMTVVGASIGGLLLPAAQGTPLGSRVKDDQRLSGRVKDMIGKLIAVCTMDESQIAAPEAEGKEPKFHGNPTECAMLQFAKDCGYNYEKIRKATTGRNEATKGQGVVKAFTSARKVMSWSVPRSEGGYRIYAKGASEIMLARATATMDASGEVQPLSDKDRQEIEDKVITPFAKMAFRTIALAYRDVSEMPDNSLHLKIMNSDGSYAFNCETELTLLAVLGISDPLRPEVPGAIQRCYLAGVDVRMVTGDYLATAVAIAQEAGILKPSDFQPDGQLKEFRAMEGKVFRKHVHKYTIEGEAIFMQEKFDEVWPYLRVLARSSPEDKLTLAKGLNGSRLYQNSEVCHRLLVDEGIRIFPDQQVVAMTGDGTNDAPALKAADVGFAMGIAGTQIAKDAADIILLDDNFASIVTAANWGRNVFDSVQKFLQFQLTVNIAILTVSLIVAFAGIDPPLKLLHLLWVNMIMDSLASIALASEPPNPEQLTRPPVNRSLFIITEQMWYNMLGQATYQVTIILIMIWMRNLLPDCEDGTGAGSRHYTMIFNTFVLFQLFNEYNSRKLRGEWNIFAGIWSNPMFLGVSLTTFILQVVMAQFGGVVLNLHPDGLTGAQWGVCLALGLFSLVWQPILNLVKVITLSAVRWLMAHARMERIKREPGTHHTGPLPTGLRNSTSDTQVHAPEAKSVVWV